jgi:hypothetical protein
MNNKLEAFCKYKASKSTFLSKKDLFVNDLFITLVSTFFLSREISMDCSLALLTLKKKLGIKAENKISTL